MAQIIKYIAQQQLDGDAGGMPRPQISGALGEAIQGLGGSIQRFGAAAQERQETKENFKAENDYRKLQLDLGQGLADKAETIAPDGTGFHDSFVSDVYRPARDKFLASVPERLRDKYATILGDDGVDTTAWADKAANTERDQTYKWYNDELGKSQEQLATAISRDPAAYDQMLQQGFSEIEASGLPTPVKLAQKAQWEKLAQTAALDRMLQQDPEGVLKDLGADPRYLSPTTQFEALKKSLIVQESGGDANAVSSAGALGVMQVMPGTAKEIARELGDTNFNQNWAPNSLELAQYMKNPVVNQRYGDYYLKKQIRAFGATGGLEAALIAYNGGPARAEAWIKSGRDDSVIPEETRKYYKEIMARLPGMSAGKGNPQSVKLVFNRGGLAPISQQTEDKVNPELVSRTKASFAALGIDTVRVTSGLRTRDDNDRVGGVGGSQHLDGNAMDIDVNGYSTERKQQLISTLSANGVTGIGVYNGHIHVDLGGRRAWGPDKHFGSVPPWAKGVIDQHMAGTAKAPTGAGVGPSGRYATLPYADRQRYIANADQAVTQRYNETSKASAVQRVELQSRMDDELASIRATGQGTNQFDDTAVSTVLGEDDYVKWANEKRKAQRMFVARDGLGTATISQMDERLADYEPVPGSPTYADDIQVQAAVQKEIDKITKLRATRPDEGAMQFPDVAAAHDKVRAGMDQGNLNPEDVQTFVKVMLDRQKEFNLKPGSEAPVPREWAMEIGKSLARVPELAGKNAPEVNAAIIAQYTSLQKAFGPYTEEVILYALSEYHGVGKNTAELLTGYMQAIEAGGDPLRLKPGAATDRDQVESSSDEGLWTRFKKGVGEFISGEEDPAAPDDPGQPEPTAPPSPETIIRVIGALNGADTPEEEADIVARYGQAAVDAAKMRIESGKQ